MALVARPCILAQANEMINSLHRHHKKVTGHRFSIAAWAEDELVGVAVIGRPVGRELPQYDSAEVTRLL